MIRVTYVSPNQIFLIFDLERGMRLSCLVSHMMINFVGGLNPRIYDKFNLKNQLNSKLLCSCKVKLLPFQFVSCNPFLTMHSSLVFSWGKLPCICVDDTMFLIGLTMMLVMQIVSTPTTMLVIKVDSLNQFEIHANFLELSKCWLCCQIFHFHLQLLSFIQWQPNDLSMFHTWWRYSLTVSTFNCNIIQIMVFIQDKFHYDINNVMLFIYSHSIQYKICRYEKHAFQKFHVL